MPAPLMESLHGVLMQIDGYGVFITGQAGIGKSSLALELLHHGHQLIADDIVDFNTYKNNQILGTCPEMLSGLLHTRELGVIDVKSIFGSQSIKPSAELNVIIHLDSIVDRDSSLEANVVHKRICQQAFPCLTLSVNNPATLYHRLQVWLKLLKFETNAAEQLVSRQHKMMSVKTK